MRGAAIATVMGQVASFIVSVTYIPRFKTLRFDVSALRLHAKVCGGILSLGVSSFITQIAITIVMVLFNNLLKTYGAASIYGAEIPLTAMGIVMKVNQIMLSILVGIAIGAQPVKFRVIPENEIPRVSTRGFLFDIKKNHAIVAWLS